MPKLQIVLPNGELAVRDLSDEKNTVGRLADNTIQIDDGSVSSHHAEIVWEGGLYHLHDLGSTNGTFVNDEQMTDSLLKHGDQIRFGAIDVVFQDDSAKAEVPLPEAAPVTAEAASGSRRPSGFVCSAPVPKDNQTKDPLAVLIYLFAVVAILAFGASVFFVYQLSAS